MSFCLFHAYTLEGHGASLTFLICIYYILLFTYVVSIVNTDRMGALWPLND